MTGVLLKRQSDFLHRPGKVGRYRDRDFIGAYTGCDAKHRCQQHSDQAGRFHGVLAIQKSNSESLARQSAHNLRMKNNRDLIVSYAGALGHAITDKRIEILRLVGQSGSISQAARDAGVSYKAAWQALDTLSNMGGAPLVARSVGGVGGGGARLTPAGEQLLDAARQMDGARRDVLARFSGGAAQALSGVGLRTSMRN